MSRKKKKHYFTQEHEDAIIAYVNTNDRSLRTHLYIEYLEPVFDEMVDKIIYTYKFTTLPNIDVLKRECKIWIITVLDKFNPDKGYKAFSYFSVITKNWFIHKIKTSSNQVRKEIHYEELPKELEQKYMSSLIENYEQKREKKEFWNTLKNEIYSWKDEELKENEDRILEAIIILFETVEDIEIFNKKAFYLYLREITGLNTKQIVNSLNNLREKYFKFREKWNNSKL